MKIIQGSVNKYQISRSDCFWNMICRMDDNSKKLYQDEIQNKRGVYVFWDWNDNPIRIGKGVKARQRILSYYSSQSNYYVFKKMQDDIQYVSVIYTKSEQDSCNIELDLLQTYQPKYNNHNTITK